MRFWDSSAVVPLVIDESSTSALQQAYKADPSAVYWCLTPVETWSAVARKRREGRLNSPDIRNARRRLEQLMREWVEIIDVAAVHRRAVRLLDVHPLRAADALQLAAALTATEDRPEGATFVTLDARLAEVAESEGFQLLGSVAE